MDLEKGGGLVGAPRPAEPEPPHVVPSPSTPALETLGSGDPPEAPNRVPSPILVHHVAAAMDSVEHAGGTGTTNGNLATPDAKPGASSASLDASARAARSMAMAGQRPPPGPVKLYLSTAEEAVLDGDGYPIMGGITEDVFSQDPRGQELLNLLRAQSELEGERLVRDGRLTFRTKRRRMSVRSKIEGVNLIDTFRYMQYRKMERQRTGRYKSSNSSRIMWISFTVILFLGFLGLLGGTTYAGIGSSVVNLLLTLFVFPLLFYIVVKVTLLARVVFYFFLLGLLAYVAANVAFVYNPKPEYVNCPLCDPEYGVAIRAIIITTVCLMAVALLAHLALRYLYPWLVRQGTVGSEQDAVKWWRIKPMKNAFVSSAGHWAWASYSYEAWEPRKWKMATNTFSYRGSIGTDGKPHGFGEWKDDAFSGECLAGWWEDGFPVGPFRSRETGTGNAFKCIRIGFVSNSSKPWDNPTFIPERNANGLSWGFATVECSVAGSFFTNLPEAKMIIAPTFMKDQEDIVDDVIDGMNAGTLPLQSESGTAAVIDTSRVAALERQPTSSEETEPMFRASQKPSAVLSSPAPIEAQEALVFVPGFNSNSKWAMRVLGQLLTYAEFPDRIKPFVFSWPGGRELSFFQAKAMAMNPLCHDDFVEALKQLGKRFRAVHLFAHSMGPRIPLGISDRLGEVFLDLEEVRRMDAGEDLGDGGLKPRLLSFTMLNAEAPLKPFVNHQFQELRRYTELITLYADQEDGALSYAEIFTKLNWFEPKEPDYRALGYKIGGLYHKFKDGVLQSPTVDLEAGMGTTEARRSYELEVIGGGISGQSRASWEAPGTVERPGGKFWKRYLDMDVVDTTLLKVNVQALRHAYFSLQRSLVDDLYDIIVKGLRARDRERLLHIDNNLFTYLVAPPFVDSVRA
ncbi:hypothetical protein DFJ74DRAFT_688198 [Hyaloraphidium curvatum]|nr:hypothetical protein DFJ74DRAFT_688198 [Hyaloraphidium curvatum]